jgi:hypothetical protein
MGESTQSMRPVRCRSHAWQSIAYGQLVVVVVPTMVVMTAALVVSSILAPSIGAFAPPAPTEPPETSAHPDGSQQQQNRESFHLKPYLSVCRVVPALAVVQTVADARSSVARGMPAGL